MANRRVEVASNTPCRVCQKQFPTMFVYYTVVNGVERVVVGVYCSGKCFRKVCPSR